MSYEHIEESKQVGDFTAQVVYDEYGSDHNPRDNDGCYTDLVLFHGRYDLPNDLDLRHEDYDGWDDMEAAIRKEYPDTVLVLPIAGYDHSGFTIYVGTSFDRWDGGRVGFAVVRRSRIASFQGEHWAKRITAKKRADLEEWARAEIKEYDDWANGRVYFWRVLDADENVVESCHGYIGDEGVKYALSEAVHHAEWEQRELDEKRRDDREQATIERLVGFVPVLDRLPALV